MTKPKSPPSATFKRVLITGAAGMLGNAICPYFEERFPFVFSSDKNPSEMMHALDVRDEKAAQEVFADIKPDLVLHLAAETDLEFCEENADIAQATNADAPGLIARLARQYDATLVYISTAGVFDGEKEGFYTEDDPAHPIMVYGQTKYDGELQVAKHCDKHFVVRAGWMVGGGAAKDHKFVSKILQQLLDGQQVIYAVNDKLGTPTYTYDFASNLQALLKTNQYGLYHMVCEGFGSRYDVAKELVAATGIPNVEICPVDSSYFAKEYFAPRPRSEMMKNARLSRLGINQMRNWQEAIHDYVQTHYAHNFQEAMLRGR